MDFIDWLFLALTVALLLLSGLFSASEIGVLSMNRFRLHQYAEEGNRRAQLLQRLLEHPSRLLTVVLISITSINYITETVDTYWLHDLVGLPEWVPFAGLLVLVLIVAELTPINYAAANPETVALRVAPLLYRVTILLNPIVTVVSFIATGALRLLGGKPHLRPLVTGEEVRTIVDIETERGVLEEEEKELIHSIFEFSDTVVREIMVPRIDMVAVSADEQLDEAIELTIAHRFSRLPVYEEDLDHVIGLVNAKDMLPYQLRRQTDIPVRQALRPVSFVPETKRVSELLREFRESKQTLTIVLDEYGGTAGLVTVEDLLEEIVGEIYDEYDIEQRSVEWLDSRTMLVDGKLPVDELSDLLDHQLPEGDYDTVGGLLYSRFGDVPTLGEEENIEDYTFIVERLDGHRIAKVRILLPPHPDIEEEEG
ncbi:MAG: hemolysin family protein [Armatimonadota bacterium]